MATPTTIIILTRDRRPKLERALAALVPQLEEADEILVIDTGSKDGTAEWLAETPPPHVRLLHFAGEGSWAEARNLGLREAKGEFIAFLDDDCYPAPDWMERGRASLATAEAVGGFVAPHAVERWPDWWDARMGWLVGYSIPGHESPEAGSYFYPYTSNLWLRAALGRAEPFQELGGAFGNEEKERYALGREDAEWWRRIRVRGHMTAFDPLMRVEHDIDTARFNWDYLVARARRDGEAWARREGTVADLEPLAYQVLQLSHGRRTPADARVAKLEWERAGDALHALSHKLAAERGKDHSPLRAAFEPKMRAHFRFLRDRAKDVARRVALAASPPRKAAWPTEPPRRIAIAALGFLGDLIILQGVVRGILEADPDRELWLAAPPAAELVFAGIDRLHLTILPSLDSPGESMRDALGHWLNAARPEFVISPYLHGAGGAALVRLLHAAKWGAPLASFVNDQGLTRQLDRERVPLKIQKDLTLHEARNLEALFAEAKVQSRSTAPRIEIGETARAVGRGIASEAFGAEAATPLLLINPDAGQPFKQWTSEAWAEMLGALAQRIRHRFLINLSRPNPELEEAVSRAGIDGWRIGWLRSVSLDILAATLADCAGIITVDSGPQHLAHALRIPSLTLYGPMDERRWTGLWDSQIHRTIRGGMFDLTPEELRGLPVNHLMRLIAPERVAEAAIEHFSV